MSKNIMQVATKRTKGINTPGVLMSNRWVYFCHAKCNAIDYSCGGAPRGRRNTSEQNSAG